MTKTRAALGRGLSALLPEPETSEPTNRSTEVDLDRLTPNRMQPRTAIDQSKLDELAQSIRSSGVIQPIIVRRLDSDSFEIVAGERRWRAAQRAGLLRVPIVVREVSDDKLLELALIENLQREDLNPVEEAQAYTRLAKDFGMTQEEIATRVGKNRATIANAMRLLDLSSEVQKYLVAGHISIGHAKVILGVKLKNEQTVLADQIIKRGMTVRSAEKLISDHLNPDSKKIASSRNKAQGQLSAALSKVQERLRNRLSTQVQIHQGAKKGKIEIEYYSNEDLQRILELIGAIDAD